MLHHVFHAELLLLYESKTAYVCCSHAMWKAAVDCISVLDVLMALSYYSRHGDGGNMCRPHFIQPDSDTQVGRFCGHFRPFF